MVTVTLWWCDGCPDTGVMVLSEVDNVDIGDGGGGDSGASVVISAPIERSRKRRRRCEDDESGASTDGRSLHMADEFVIQAVDQTVAYARAHPNEFGLAPEQVCMLEKSVSVAEGNGELPADHPMSKGTMTELVQVMVSVLADIQACQKHDGNNGNGKSVMREGDYSSFDRDILHSPHSPHLD
ncbi:hypothetical protein POM88_034085 [Heracleum sosnowskyi]|uniref:Uncharacterized protein n=1 Tax=Heracleum sosnowskyi TaxID=360622 RepID=A0AAD8HKM1_9APIA|nr:hypothetical protein POM88_034085 [Heracleum sosnowskyi]